LILAAAIALAAALLRPGPSPVGQAAAVSATRPASKPGPADSKRRAVIITIDGLRPDVLLRVNAPNIRRLMASGAFTFWAQTVPECYTLPAHVSILTGVSPQVHGVEWNDHIEQAFPLVPTLFELAHRGGLTTAMVTGKTKFIALDKPGTIDWKFLPYDEPNPDALVAAEGVKILHQFRPSVTVVHLADTDVVGHAVGWGTPEQLKFVEEADRQVGVVLAAVAELGWTDSALVVLTADHGGAGLEHGPDDPRSRCVPWIVSGPGVRRDFDLTRDADLTVNTLDTLPTVCDFLGLAWGPEVEGRVVREIFEEQELLRERK
jgi:predicted AlkP superfamily pyrophosphatase or phosphodiesterase